MKPRVIELLLVTTAPVMVLAARGVPDVWLILGTLVGGALSAGSANAFNMYIDRDIDTLMARTKGRPIVTGEVSPRSALIFAFTIGLASLAVLTLVANLLAAALSLAAILFYVFVYTLLLKRRTEQNIVWGGIAGCFPVLIGWAAVTGEISVTPWILFVVVFLWTPAHYWPLSLRYADDYAAASVPMLSVLRPKVAVGLQVILYAWATVVASLVLIPVAPMGVVYSVVAVLAGGWFIVETHRLYNRSVAGGDTNAMRVFHASNTYLTALFIAVAIDPLVVLR
ncbi:MAG: protoheme IX farnesyltransferase [Actinobacteria bacterium]|uniref:Protoheme IX farnesyltransferase n=1 Tax=freshwater metagenome TaxID=449393 RepID=A0A6J7CTH0_9ZZZZ|nr:protoheme IX farnesyltransferase [Actinomycetota bacterium]